MAKFFYSRTKRVVDIPDHLADEYEKRRWYVRLPSPIQPPSGTVAEILKWAGGDPAKRAAALTAERAGKNRKGIIETLR